MLSYIRILFRYFISWIFFFWLARAAFILSKLNTASDAGFEDLLFSFFYGLKLDVSAACYLLVIPFLIHSIYMYFPRTWLLKLLGFYISIVFFLLMLISCSDILIYKEWGTHLNSYGLSFIQYPKEVLASALSSISFNYIFIVTILLIVPAILLAAALKRARPDLSEFIEKKKSQRFQKPLLILLLALLLSAGIRGGFDVSPVNQSSAYFSDKPFANHAALNASWNLFYSLSNSGSGLDQNAYHFMEDEEAMSLFSELYKNDISSKEKIFKNNPNIVLVILESWPADLVGSVGGESATPEFDKLSKNGILFNNFYANGDRTDKGLAAILSGYPAQPSTSIITQPEKAEKLPSLVKALEKKQYQSSFIYGGESEFANMRAYLLNLGFDRIIEKKDFEKAEMNSKWGAHDHVVFEKAVSYYSTLKAPFFSTILTLSSHEPFEIPGTGNPGTTVEEKFRNSVHYTDSCIGVFINDCKKTSWFKNTVFIFVSDHGHRLPKDRAAFDPEKYHIPLLFYGDGLTSLNHGRIIPKLASQTDLSLTISTQLGIEAKEFKYSKDLFSSSGSFAFFCYDNGLGWLEPKQEMVYDNVAKAVIWRKPETDANKQEKLGKAYLQVLWKDYFAK